jgi:hypothetical protein
MEEERKRKHEQIEGEKEMNKNKWKEGAKTE